MSRSAVAAIVRELLDPDGRKFNPNQPRDEDGQWSDGISAGLSLAPGEEVLSTARISSSDYADIFLATTRIAGQRRTRIGISQPDEGERWGGDDPLTVSLDDRGLRILTEGLAELDEMGKERLKEVRALNRRLDELGDEGPEADALNARLGEIAGDGQIVANGSAPASGGDIQYRLVMSYNNRGRDDVALQIAVRPAGQPNWDMDTALGELEAAELSANRQRKLREQLAAAASAT